MAAEKQAKIDAVAAAIAEQEAKSAAAADAAAAEAKAKIDMEAAEQAVEPDVPVKDVSSSELIQEVLDQHNLYRTRHGAPPLTINESVYIKINSIINLIYFKWKITVERDGS